MKVEVKRITDPNLFRECAEMTTGKPCRMSWNKALCSGHSIIRAEEYLIKLYDIPQCVMGHLVRHIHAQPYVLSKRPDRGGENFSDVCAEWVEGLEHVESGWNEDWMEMINLVKNEFESLPTRFGRMSPTSMALKLNAEEIINISKVRLCSNASKETQEVWKAVVSEICNIDPDLYRHCHPTCVFRGGICPEPKSCGYNKSEMFNKHLESYKKLFQQ